MLTYESPAITELGSVADFTRADGIGLDFDGMRPIEIWGRTFHVPDLGNAS
jgi:hypothetical protein